MSSIHHRKALGIVAGAATLAALVGVAGTASAAPAVGSTRPHTAYTTTNSPAGNQVIELQSSRGSLAIVAQFSTGGTGTGSSLGSQGAVAVDGDRLLAVDAGSNDVALFRIGGHGELRLVDRESSGGVEPVSLSVHDGVVAVLNAGDESVTTLRIRGNHLDAVAGSRRVLAGAGGAEVAFDHEGDRVVVSEKASNTLVTLSVRHGVLGTPVVTASSAATPYGFAIDRHDHVIVTDAAGGAPAGSALSSYSIARNGSLVPVTSTLGTTQTAACWLTLSTDGRFAYDTNAGSGTISRSSVGRDGSLTLVEAVAATPGAGPVDLVATSDSLFTLNSGAHTVSLHAIVADGSLSPVTSVAVPTGVAGLAVR